MPTPNRQPERTIKEFPLIPGYQPGSITSGPDGALWFIEMNPNAQNDSTALSSKIGRITLAGQISEFSLPSGTYVGTITAGPDDALWFTAQTSSSDSQNASSPFNSYIGRITTDGKISEFPLPPDTLPKDITTGLDDALWFTEISPYPAQNGVINSKIGRITTDGHISEFLIPTRDSSELPVFGITSGPDGNLWFRTANKIGRITPSGTISEFALSSESQPGKITTGSDKALWFTEIVSNPTTRDLSGKIGRITPTGTISEFVLPVGDQPGASALIFSITSGSDGNLWFGQVGKIGRITPSGTVSEVPLSTSDSICMGITTGSDRALWFTEWDNKKFSGKIGRLAL